MMTSDGKVLRGIAAIYDMLDCIGDEERRDKDVAKILVDYELSIRCLAHYATGKIAADNL